MSKYSSVLGMDVHASSVSVCAIVADTGQIKEKTFRGTDVAAQIADWASKHLPGPFHAAYESGCTGFVLARKLLALGIHCDVIAVSTLAKSTRSKQRKNDRSDAANIAFELLKPVHSFSCV